MEGYGYSFGHFKCELFTSGSSRERSQAEMKCWASSPLGSRENVKLGDFWGNQVEKRGHQQLLKEKGGSEKKRG